MRRVVITGMGAVTPLGLNVEETWQRLLNGESGISKITLFDPEAGISKMPLFDPKDFSVQIAGEVKDFNIENFIEPTDLVDLRDLKTMDRCAQLALACASMALADAKLKIPFKNPEKVGVTIGSGIGGEWTWANNQTTLIEKGPQRVSPRTIIGTMLNGLAALVGIYFRAKGINLGIAAACASGNFAIGEAFEIIKRGDAIIMITGGAESTGDPLTLAAFAKMGALSRNNDFPEKASRPFDKDRDGFVLSEGAGIIILEELEHALKRGARIYGEIVGYGASFDAYHITQPEPDGIQAARAMELALDKAGIYPNMVDYINAHGTATPVGDPAEAKAIYRVFGNLPDMTRYKTIPPVSSTKSSIGHLVGAAGAVELIFCLLAIKYEKIPPTINLDSLDPECDFGIDHVANKPREAKVNIALNNSFGFGGHNACLVVKKFS